jgi:hypothetical protein
MTSDERLSGWRGIHLGAAAQLRRERRSRECSQAPRVQRELRSGSEQSGSIAATEKVVQKVF